MEKKITADKKKERLTRYRRLVLDVVSKNPHLDAYAIHQLALQKDPKISLPTVYRALKYLKEHGLIVERKFVENHAHYELPEAKQLGDVLIHLVCKRCGKIDEAGSIKLELVDDLATGFDFELSEVHLNLFGLCQACRKKRS
jgi:Fe2+ or Zn2+ uptake regulation protein